MGTARISDSSQLSALSSGIPSSELTLSANTSVVYARLPKANWCQVACNFQGMNDFSRMSSGRRGRKCYGGAGSIECVPRCGDKCNNTQAGLGRPGPVGKAMLSDAVPLAGFETGASNGWGP